MGVDSAGKDQEAFGFEDGIVRGLEPDSHLDDFPVANADVCVALALGRDHAAAADQ
jgi:hypothetical protein